MVFNICIIFLLVLNDWLHLFVKLGFDGKGITFDVKKCSSYGFLNTYWNLPKMHLLHQTESLD